ncbi:hypothetical protein ISCGN_020408 [Ixodes scapularis]
MPCTYLPTLQPRCRVATDKAHPPLKSCAFFRVLARNHTHMGQDSVLLLEFSEDTWFTSPTRLPSGNRDVRKPDLTAKIPKVRQIFVQTHEHFTCDTHRRP